MLWEFSHWHSVDSSVQLSFRHRTIQTLFLSSAISPDQSNICYLVYSRCCRHRSRLLCVFHVVSILYYLQWSYRANVRNKPTLTKSFIQIKKFKRSIFFFFFKTTEKQKTRKSKAKYIVFWARLIFYLILLVYFIRMDLI